MASLKDVAKLAGVSLMTVSRAINNPEQLSDKTYRAVKQAIEDLNYVPNLSAQKIRGVDSANKSIGVLSLGTATTPFSVDIILAIEQTVRKFGWNSFLINAFEEDENEVEKAVELLLSHRPSAIIITRNGLKKIKIPKALQQFPIVLANCVTDDLHIASYIPHDFQGQFDATQLVIRKGYKKPLCLYIPENAIAAAERQKGFEAAWFAQAEPALPVQFFMPKDLNDYVCGADPLKDILRRSSEPFDFDVIICGNDRIAMLVYQLLLSRGIRIPEDVAVIGYDNMVGVAELFLPPLTTVQLPHYEIGEQATLHLIEGRMDKKVHRLHCPLIERDSC